MSVLPNVSPLAGVDEQFKAQTSFAERAQNIVMAMLMISLVLTAQGFSLFFSQVGLVALALFVPLQIAVSNVDSKSNARQTVKKSIIILAIVALIFVFSIWITPILVSLGP